APLQLLRVGEVVVDGRAIVHAHSQLLAHEAGDPLARVAAHARGARVPAVAEGDGMIEYLILHLLIGHDLERLDRTVHAADAITRLAVVAEHLERRGLAGDLALAAVQ